MHRLHRLIATLLVVSLGIEPGAFAQRGDAPPLEIGPLNSSVISVVPTNIAQGVFGVYGGKESRLSGDSKGNASLRAPLAAVQLPDLGDGSGGTLSPQEERKIFEAGDRSEGEAVRSSPSLDVLAADIARGAGRHDEAVRLGELAQRRWPGSHAAIDTHLQALLAARRYADAQALAQQDTAGGPGEPAWWRYPARASAGMGDGLTQRRALAEAFALEGAWPSAVRQLKEALDIKPVGYYDQAIIVARLHEFEARYDEEPKDDKDLP